MASIAINQPTISETKTGKTKYEEMHLSTHLHYSRGQHLGEVVLEKQAAPTKVCSDGGNVHGPDRTAAENAFLRLTSN